MEQHEDIFMLVVLVGIAMWQQNRQTASPPLHAYMCSDLPPSLQQGMGFGIYIKGVDKNKSLPLNGMPCSFSLKRHV